jgi:hypothetical protein
MSAATAPDLKENPMTVMANPTEPLLNVLSPRLCPECGQLTAPQGAELAEAIAASFSNSIRQLMAPGAPGHRLGYAQGHRHSRHAPAGYQRGRGSCGCGCGERGHEDCGRRGRHGHADGWHGHEWHGHEWQGHDWPGRQHEHHWHGHKHDGCRHCDKEDWRRRECWACDDDCRVCEDTPCECRCCIPRCDVLIYGRSGETRLLPVVIENHRHREREITLHISDWKTVGEGNADVTTVDLAPATFELKACSRQTVQLRISIGGKERQPPEVCTVACADLTVDGCDMKPMRIAVAVLPLECGPYRIDCSCGCC